MGEARRKGTYEERKSMALDKKQERADEIRAALKVKAEEVRAAHEKAAEDARINGTPAPLPPRPSKSISLGDRRRLLGAAFAALAAAGAIR